MPDFDPAADVVAVVIFCPVCVTNTDAEGEGEQEFVCNNCGTKFVVTIDAGIVAEHAMFG